MVDRVRAQWTGFPGGPGLSTFYATDGTAAVGPLSTFFGHVVGYMPTDVSINIPSAGDVINPVTGLITGGWSGGTPTPHQGEMTGNYSAPTGVLVSWGTGQVRAGRRVRGRTFLVPMGNPAFQPDGSVSPVLLSSLQAWATELIAALPGDLFVLQRATPATPQWTDVRGVVHPAKLARAGEAVPITSASIPDKAVVLRSRRD